MRVHVADISLAQSHHGTVGVPAATMWTTCMFCSRLNATYAPLHTVANSDLKPRTECTKRALDSLVNS